MKNDSFASALLIWFDVTKRTLPFRETRNPYFIWVSEIMAQQTRISALLPYFEKFIARFPTVEALAAAQESEVLTLWAGLGYYSRARNLHKAAQLLCREHGGQLPRSLTALRALPGVGDYTAGAIASIAFGLQTPAVDGNVLRVFARLTAYRGDIRATEAKSAATAWVQSHMTKQNAGALTEALMELGALVCIPGGPEGQSPRCDICPVSNYCQARGQGLTGQLPLLSAKTPPRPVRRTVLLLRNAEGAYALRQRTERLLKGMWEFPSDEDADAAGLLYTRGAHVLDVRHVFTHLIWEMEGLHGTLLSDALPEGWCLAQPETLPELALPSAMRAFAAYVSAESAGDAPPRR